VVARWSPVVASGRQVASQGSNPVYIEFRYIGVSNRVHPNQRGVEHELRAGEALGPGPESRSV
jgi:hypothetical protein